jgi:two-component system phosphate regulon sensor histidine kinase PhoR
MKNIRLFWQIFPAIIITTMITLVTVVWYISTTSRDFYLEQLQVGLQDRALLIESSIASYAATSQERLHSFIRTAGRKASTRITLIDKDGLVLSDSNEDYKQMDNHANRP